MQTIMIETCIKELKGLVTKAESKLEALQKMLVKDEGGDESEAEVDDEEGSDNDMSVHTIGSNDGLVEVASDQVPAV